MAVRRRSCWEMTRLFFSGARDDAEHGLFQIGHGDGAAAFARSQKRCLIEQICQVRTCEPGCRSSHIVQVDIVCQRLVAGVDPEDFLASVGVGAPT